MFGALEKLGFLMLLGALNKLGVLVPLDPLSTSGFLTINGLIIYAFLRLL